jgi:hypothetical protein
MHSNCLVALPENAPLEEEGLYKYLSDRLHVYNQNYEVEPYKLYSTQEYTVFLAKHRGFPDVEAFAQHLEATPSTKEGVENGQFFHISTWNKNGRWDYFSIIKIATLKEFKELNPDGLFPYSVVDQDGRWYSERDYGHIPKLDYFQSQPHPDNVEPIRQWECFLRAFFEKYEEHTIFVWMDVHS